jgi:hypothetical protein
MPFRALLQSVDQRSRAIHQGAVRIIVDELLGESAGGLGLPNSSQRFHPQESGLIA